MRKIGFAILLFSFFPCFVRAGISVSDTGDYLLRAVKAVADSGRADDPATVASLLNISLTRSIHGVSYTGECPAGGHRIDDNYAVTSNSWFRPLPTGKQHMIIQILPQLLFYPNGKQTESALGDPTLVYDTRGVLHCANPTQNQVLADIGFGNIPAYACINEPQIKAIFPNTHPGPLLTDAAWGPDFVYSNRDTTVSFQMTLRPGVVDPHHQPVCLMSISIFSKSQFGPLHEPDLGQSPTGHSQN